MGGSSLILDIFLAAAGLAIALMLFLGNYRLGDLLAQHDVAARGYTLRRYWFWAMLIGAIAAFFLTVPHFPYPWVSAAPNSRHISVVAQQYSFTVAQTIPLDVPIVFDVTSDDVNHGFGIYAPDGRLISQVQAMPGYVNRLPITFHQRGHYEIRCLEFCGIAHASMRGGFDVQ
jgi:cytochrome c oxidase subunit II